RVDLDAEDGPGVLGQADGQAAGAAADLDRQVVAGQLGVAQQQVEQVEVDEEVLAELVPGPDAALLEQVGAVAQGLPRRLGSHDAPSARGGREPPDRSNHQGAHAPRSPRSRDAHRETYLASTSVSRLTAAPGGLNPSVVFARVCGMSATLK